MKYILRIPGALVTLTLWLCVLGFLNILTILPGLIILFHCYIIKYDKDERDIGLFYTFLGFFSFLLAWHYIMTGQFTNKLNKFI